MMTSSSSRSGYKLYIFNSPWFESSENPSNSNFEEKQKTVGDRDRDQLDIQLAIVNNW